MLQRQHTNRFGAYVGLVIAVVVACQATTAQADNIGDYTGCWKADDLTGTAGTAVSSWTDTVSSAAAANSTADYQPTIVTTGFNGHKAVHFDGVNDNLQVANTDNPMNGVTDFTLAVVFNSNGGGKVYSGAGGQWYFYSGIVDAEIGGGHYDWGLSLTDTGNLAAGTGSETAGDTTLISTASGLNKGTTHVAIYRKSGDTLSLTIDGGTTVSTTGASTVARGDYGMAFGSLLPLPDNGFYADFGYYKGDIAQVNTYGRALSNSETALLSSSLTSIYIIPEPSAITLLITGLIGLLAYAWRKRR